MLAVGNFRDFDLLNNFTVKIFRVSDCRENVPMELRNFR